MLPTMKACAASSYLSSDAKALSTIYIIMWVEVAHIRGEPKGVFGNKNKKNLWAKSGLFSTDSTSYF